jgi:hypothetical protein
MSAQSPSGVPPDRLEPFAAQMTLTAGTGGVSEPARLFARLLTDIAERCDSSGSALIGHIKCHARTVTDAGAHTFHCNLTSLRLGARCSGDPPAVAPLGVLEIDLVALVYGLARTVLEQIVRECCSLHQGLSGSTIEVRPRGGQAPLAPAVGSDE